MKKRLWIVCLFPVGWYIWYDWKSMVEFGKAMWPAVVAMASVLAAFVCYFKYGDDERSE